ncbi:MAG: hypothetical protein HY786_06370 [Deltaproteobacteria bacterium]|nr:hypothetical protein [Deltaproteobacteria bacterium]
MNENIEDVLLVLEEITRKSGYLKLAILDNTKSILKARVFFKEDIYVQIYVNNRKPKNSYTLIMNDKRIFGKDYVWGTWHAHPFEHPELHNTTEEGGRPVTVRDFIDQAAFILSEKLDVI